MLSKVGQCFANVGMPRNHQGPGWGVATIQAVTQQAWGRAQELHAPQAPGQGCSQLPHWPCFASSPLVARELIGDHLLPGAGPGMTVCIFVFRFVHPRFGPIKCIRTLRAVEADEELTVAYGYDHSPPGKSGPEAPEWYQVELKAFQATQQK